MKIIFCTVLTIIIKKFTPKHNIVIVIRLYPIEYLATGSDTNSVKQ